MLVCPQFDMPLRTVEHILGPSGNNRTVIDIYEKTVPLSLPRTARLLGVPEETLSANGGPDVLKISLGKERGRFVIEFPDTAILRAATELKRLQPGITIMPDLLSGKTSITAQTDLGINEALLDLPWTEACAYF